MMARKKKLFKIEISECRDGVVIWGSRDAFHEMHHLLWDCWGDVDDDFTREEQVSYIGIMAYFSYEIRHTYMGDRHVKLDGKDIEEWTDERIEQYNDENNKDRYVVGAEFPFACIIFVLAAWWECFRHRDCPTELLPILRDMQKGVERAIKSVSPSNWPRIEPYLHGAIYAADPYVEHTMEHVDNLVDRFGYPRPMRVLADELPTALYGSEKYHQFHKELEDAAAKFGCPISHLSIDYEALHY